MQAIAMGQLPNLAACGLNQGHFTYSTAIRKVIAWGQVQGQRCAK